MPDFPSYSPDFPSQPTGGSGGSTEPTISSSLGNVEDQTGAYAPTLTVSGGATVSTVAYNNVTGAVSVTGSTTTTPSVPEPAAGSATVITHTATADGLTKTIAFVVGKASAVTPFVDPQEVARPGLNDPYLIGGREPDGRQ